MTLEQAFVFKSGNIASPSEAHDVLSFNGINPSSDWNPNDTQQRCSFFDALLSFLNSNNAGVSSESEGGYSKSYDRQSKRDWLYSLALESGCQKLIDAYNPSPSVQNKSNMW